MGFLIKCDPELCQPSDAAYEHIQECQIVKFGFNIPQCCRPIIEKTKFITPELLDKINERLDQLLPPGRIGTDMHHIRQVSAKQAIEYICDKVLGDCWTVYLRDENNKTIWTYFDYRAGGSSLYGRKPFIEDDYEVYIQKILTDMKENKSTLCIVLGEEAFREYYISSSNDDNFDIIKLVHNYNHTLINVDWLKFD